MIYSLISWGLLAIAFFLLSPPDVHSFQQLFLRPVDPGRRSIANLHVTKSPRKIRIDLRVENIGKITCQLSKRYVIEAAFTIQHINQLDQVGFVILPR